jgi:beta-lactam-binding protein with PASTA domain
VVFTMPDVVGMNLQDAQDTLQALGSYLMDQVDATGMGRAQVWDRNWRVCTQDPAPDTTVPIETIVTLSAVKLDESC